MTFLIALCLKDGLSVAKASSRELFFEDKLPAAACPSDTLRAALAKSSWSAEHIATPDATKYKFPHPKVEGLDFSFSGLKTAVLREVQKELGLPISHPSYDLKNHLTEQQVADFAASFQKTAVDILVEKLKMALEQYPDVKSVVVAGGVSANELLRKEITSRLGTRSLSPSPRVSAASPRAAALRIPQDGDVISFFPAPSLSGDNGAMVAAAAYFEIQSGVEPTDPYSLNIYPRISIED